MTHSFTQEDLVDLLIDEIKTEIKNECHVDDVGPFAIIFLRIVRNEGVL